MPPILTIFPESGYLNTTFAFKLSASTSLLKLIILRGEEEIKTITNLHEGIAVFSSFDTAGIYTAMLQVEGSDPIRKSFKISDSIILGDSVLRSSFCFDGLPIHFLVKRDRTIIYDERSAERFELNGISPTNISELNGRYILFETLISPEKDLYNYGFFDVQQLAIVYSIEQSKLLFWNPFENRLWLADHLENLIKAYSFSEDLSFENVDIELFKGNLLGVNHKRKLVLLEDVENELIQVLSLEEGVFWEELSTEDSFAIDLQGNFVCCVGDGKISVNVIGMKQYGYEDLEGEFRLEISADYKSRKFPLNQGYNKAIERIEDELRYMAIQEAAKQEVQPGSYFVVELDQPRIANFKEVSFQNLGHCILTSINEVEVSISSFKARKSKYYSDPQNILWDFVINETRTSQIKRFFSSQHLFELLQLASLSLVSSLDKIVHLISSTNEDYPDALLLFDFTVVYVDKRLMKSKLFKLSDGKYYSLLCSEGRIELNRLTRMGVEPVINILGELLKPDFFQRFDVLWMKSIQAPQDPLFSFEGTCVFDVVQQRFLEISRPIIPNGVPEDDREGNYSLIRNVVDMGSFFMCEKSVIVSFSPFQIRSSVTGKVIAHSKSLDRIITFRQDEGYYLYIFDLGTCSYFPQLIQDSELNYTTSELHPNGNFALVKALGSNELQIYDIQQRKNISFFHGQFVAFSNDGNIILKEDMTSNVKMFDPHTFADITPAQYHHYRFVSPDGKLYSSMATYPGYYHFLEQRPISKIEFDVLRFKFIALSTETPQQFAERKKAYFRDLNSRFSHRLRNYSKQPSELRHIVGEVNFIEIGIVGTDVVLQLPAKKLTYYNHLCFSWDNCFIGYVGKPIDDGIFELYKISFNEDDGTLALEENITITAPSLATWKCYFSKFGNYFGTYDSSPNSFLLKVNDELFKKKYDEEGLNQCVERIDKRSFECFSNNGQLAALSQKGYEPMSLGGRGHISSKELHLANVETCDIIRSFAEHGDFVKFAAFSGDDKKLLTRSDDGVIIIRNVDIDVR